MLCGLIQNADDDFSSAYVLAERRDHLVVRKEYDVPLTVILTTQVHHMAIGGTVDSPITVD